MVKVTLLEIRKYVVNSMSFGGSDVDGIVFTSPRQSNSGAAFKDELDVTLLEINTATSNLKSYGKIECTSEISCQRIKILGAITTLTSGSTVPITTYLGGIIKYNIGGNITQTTSTAASIVASVGNVVGTFFTCLVYQNSNRSITVNGGTGVTVFDGRNSNSLANFQMTFIVTSATTIDLLLK